MTKFDLVEVFRAERKYERGLLIEGKAQDGINSVRCTVVSWKGGQASREQSVHESSDAFFAGSKAKFDIVLVDGVHTCVQTLQDIENSLAALNPGGVVIVHGSIPQCEYEGRPVPGGNWCGDAFRAVAWYFSRSPYRCYTFADDLGLSVIDTALPAKEPAEFPGTYMTDLTYHGFRARRNALLHILPSDLASAQAAPVKADDSPDLVSESGFVRQAVQDGVYVVPVLNERTGNNLLQIYRGFWFAAVHGIPRDRVRITSTPHLLESPSLFSRVLGNVMSMEETCRVPFAVVHCCPDSMPSVDAGRRALVDLKLPERGAVAFTGAGFLYPELPWERSLFVHLFDNPGLRNELAAEHEGVLCGNTVGYQIRRGDFQHIPGRRRLTKEDIVSDISEIARRHFGMVRVIVTSDDQKFVESLLDENAFLRKYVFHYRDASMERQLYMLSLCDSVVVNGQYQCSSCWVNDPQLMWESTFGQIAQILNRSYKYASFPDSPQSVPVARDGLTRNGCACEYPKRTIERPW